MGKPPLFEMVWGGGCCPVANSKGLKFVRRGALWLLSYSIAALSNIQQLQSFWFALKCLK